jgi:SWIM zinc finger
MPTTWTPEQILALALDESSKKAGQGLATPSKWVTLGAVEQSAWGECQGSGAKPYQTRIDLGEPAFQCSCPSRKFPCKHALGLFLLLANQPQRFLQTGPPDWVATWLESRSKRAEQKARKSEADSTPTDPEQARRAAERQSKAASDRQAKVDAGLEDLGLWLGDLIRRGLASLPGESYAFWETPAARLVDAQAPGLARMLREMSGLPATGDGWQERLLERVARLALLLEGHRRIGTLPPETQADLRTMIGWTIPQEELLAGTGVRDRWAVLGHRVEVEDRLRVQRLWLWGLESRRPALILSFAHGIQPFDVHLPPGALLEADLVFFPGAFPLRALIKHRHADTMPIEAMPGFATIAEALASHAAALTRNPWLEAYPLPLRAVVPAPHEGVWAARDVAGALIPIAPQFGQGWHLMALGGGRPLALFGEWDGDHLNPLSAFVEDRFHVLIGSSA